MKDLVDRVKCFFGCHDWETRLTKKGRAFFARLGIDTSYNLFCSRPDCDKMKKSKA